MVRSRPNAGGDATRAALIDAAERLIADRGLDVSLREIAAAAGQRKSNAAQYHFEDRAGLVRAVLLARATPSDERRRAILADGSGDHEHLARALVEPLADDLGREGRYVRFLFRLAVARSGRLPFADDVDPRATAGFREVVAMLRQASPTTPPELLHTRVEQAVDFVVMSLANRAVREAGRRPALPRRAFVDEVVRATAAILGAPVAET